MLLFISLSVTTGCSGPAKKDDFASLITSAQAARATGHEDLAANCLKDAFDTLPGKNNPGRAQSINQIYPEILALALDLRQSGRFSLSKTMLDKAIEIEPECTIEGKQSAVVVKEETEKMGEMEINLLKRADKAKDLKDELKKLKLTTRDLVKQFQKGDYDQVARDGRAHLEVLRKTRGVASNAYCDARNLVVDSLLLKDNVTGAIKLLEDDLPELSNFKDEDLKNADENAVEAALFLSPLLEQIAGLQLSIKKYDEAEKNAKRAYALAQTMGGKLNSTSAASLVTLATIMRVRGKYKEALEASKSALPLFAKGKKHRDSWQRCLFTIAQAEADLGEHENACHDFLNLVRVAESKPQRGVSSVSLAVAAVYFRTQGDEKRYEDIKDKAIQLASRNGEPRASIEMVYELLGDGAVSMSKFTQAEDFYRAALMHASASQVEGLEKKIATCKRNRSAAS
ncbi:MAG: tetratricopeptide repeat protein [Candidatus Melainabacteria bacterium]|nr:tetratricopeptide repeat protein [Candidatus Melainabacteria bacterium]